MQKLYTLLFLLFFLNSASAQIRIEPQNPTLTDSITIYYDASQGNAALAGESTIYIHTGIITAQSENPNDWKYVKSTWGLNMPAYLMQNLGNNLFSYTIPNIQQYYNIPAGERVVALAFVFRNKTSSAVGKTVNEGDIFYPLRTKPIEYISATTFNNTLFIQTTDGVVRLDAYSPNAIAVKHMPNGYLDNPSRIIVADEGNFANISETNEGFTYSTDSATIFIGKNPMQVAYIHQSDTVAKEPMISQLFDNSGGTHSMLSFLTDTPQVYGTGSRALSLNLYNRNLEFYNQAHYGYSANTPNLNIAVPMFTTNKKFAFYLDHEHYAKAGIGNFINGLYYYTESEQTTAHYFIVGSQQQIQKEYAHLTGKAPLLPKWALGYIQSKYGYKNQQEAEQVIADLKAEGVPVDALVLDLYWFGGTSKMGNFTWDYSRFNNPVGMMSNFKQQGVKTILITEPYIVNTSSNYSVGTSNGYFTNNSSGNTYLLNNFWAGPASLLDLDYTMTFPWLKGFYNTLMQQGAEGWWCDLGEPELHPDNMWHHTLYGRELHNMYSWKWAELLYKNHLQNFPQKRMFNLIRSGWAGMQRFGTIPWSGDIQRSYEGMAIQIPLMLNMSLSGVPFMHSDLGGFTGGPQTPELYTRWMQLGAFSPIMRPHGDHLPTEPFYYPEPYKSIVKQAILERYKLMPHLYNQAFRVALEGDLMVKPLNFFDEEFSNTQALNTEFLLGDNLLVAPVLKEGQTNKTIYFPKGQWYNYFNPNEAFSDSMQIDISINDIPVFVQAKSVLATNQNQIENSSESNGRALQFTHYSVAENHTTQYEMFNDDGESTQTIENENYEYFTLKYTQTDSLYSIDLEHYNPNNITETNIQFTTIQLPQKPCSVLVNQVGIPLSFDTVYSKIANTANFNAVTKQLNINLNISESTTSIQVITNCGLANSENPFIVYPNPAQDYIKVAAFSEVESYYVFNNLGQVVLGGPQSNFDFQINISALNPGVYSLKCNQTDGNSFVQKFVKANSVD